MPGVVLLVAAVVINYLRHRRGLPTICATTRRALPRPAATSALTVGAAYLIAHIWRGYSKET